jgi:hypothetical protein
MKGTQQENIPDPTSATETQSVLACATYRSYTAMRHNSRYVHSLQAPFSIHAEEQAARKEEAVQQHVKGNHATAAGIALQVTQPVHSAEQQREGPTMS